MKRRRMLVVALILLLAPPSVLAGDSMLLQDRHEIQQECERVIHRFLRLLEGKQASTADLFTEDGQAFSHVGREKIREFFKGIEAVDDNLNVLISSNVLIDVDGQDHATASSYVTHYVAKREAKDLRDPTGAPVGGELNTARSITRWSWEFRPIKGEWLISKMKYPESVLLRRDVLEDLKRQSK